MRTLLASLGLVGLIALAQPAFSADLVVKLLPPWDGKNVPNGQQCERFGGNGSTPPMQVSNLPKGTAMVVVEFNDRSFPPLSNNGGHGTIGFPVSSSKAKLPAVPGMTDKLPHGAVVVKKARSTGAFASKGYLPPCSGGRGNRYTADIKAVDASGKVLAVLKRVAIGRY